MSTLTQANMEVPQPRTTWIDESLTDRDQFLSMATESTSRNLDELPTMSKLERSIIGNSPALREVLRLATIVAPTDATVLILGETGTGKELIARAIHEWNWRCHKSLVKFNCAALPASLLESELFGYERGAFTGAVARRAGRFELADESTLFLDEVGDIPLEIQPKLLRVLQEREFERLGSSMTTRVNVRIVAATSRDLSQMVRERQFRSDLYYRLNVFPIQVPPLRDRLEDIPLLVQYFVTQCEKTLNKRIDSVRVDFIKALTSHSWPGNVRELQNFVERAVILSQNGVLNAPIERPLCSRSNSTIFEGPNSRRTSTLREAEREHILVALRDADWVVGGHRGAASRLGLKRTTLAAKMRKFGIARPPRQYDLEEANAGTCLH